MSGRVEEEREAARAAARKAEQRRAEAERRTRVSAEAGAFAAKVARAPAPGAPPLLAGQAAVAQLLEEAQQQALLAEAEGGAAQAHREGEGEGQAALDQARLSREGQERGRRAVAVGAAGREAARDGQGRAAGDALERRGKGSLEEGSRIEERDRERRLGPRPGGARPVEASGEDGGGAASGGGGGQGGEAPGQRPGQGAAAAPQFRLHPALLPPVPVAQARDTGGSERLRKVANELAQKIVERVRVGTNALGRVEFQVDLRADVLAGLTVKVSADRGRITAVFSGGDRGVLGLIEAHAQTLTAALAARGLTLEALRTEARP